MQSIIIPSSVTSIEKGIFYGCSSLASISVERGNAVYDSRNNCNAIIETSTNELIAGCKTTVIPNSVASINSAFVGCTGLTSITIPSSVTTIDGAFSGCTRLASVTIPNSVTNIDGAFTGCSKLTSIAIPNKVTSIGYWTFQNCTSLTSVILPTTMETIGNYAFAGCSSLSSLTIPKSVTRIGNFAFQECRSLVLVKSENTAPVNVSANAFKGISSDAILQVPSGTKGKYQTLSGWSTYFKDIVEGELSLKVVVMASGAGTVSYNGVSFRNASRTFDFSAGGSATLTFAPDAGYRLASMMVDNVDVTSKVSNNQYIISNIKATTTVAVTFEVIPSTSCSLEISVSSGGSVSYGGDTFINETNTYTVEKGSSATIMLYPNPGFRLESVKVDGSDVTSKVSNNQYTVEKIMWNTTVVVSFEEIPPSYSLNITASTGGFVSYSGENFTNKTNSYSLEEGRSAALTFTPNSGFRVASVKVNGQDVTAQVANGQYTISNIKANTTVVVTFEEIPPTTYQLTIAVSAGGFVSYNGENVSNKTNAYSVVEGKGATLVITPNAGYQLVSVKVNGTDVTSQMSNGQYVISNIKQNMSVTVTFEQIPECSLTITAIGNGDVTYGETTLRSLTRSFAVEIGSSANLTIKPDAGFRIANVKVNGTIVVSLINTSQYSYVVKGITTDTTVEVLFEAIPPTTFALNISASGNGYVSYNGHSTRNRTREFTVDEGTSVTLTITPDASYRIASVKMNDKDVTSQVSNGQYTINNIIANTTVEVSFEAIPPTTYQLTIAATGNGGVSYDGKTVRGGNSVFVVTEGSAVTITFTPDAGYRVASVKVNDKDVTSQVSNGQYTINNIMANTTVEVLFEAIPPTTFALNISASGNGYVSYNGHSTRNRTREFTVDEGTSVTLTITPDASYRIASVKVNDKDVTSQVSNGQYTINNIMANTTVEVSFEAIPPTTYQLTIVATGNGGVSYDGKTVRGGNNVFEVTEGSSATIKFTPDAGYRVASVNLNGQNVTMQVVNGQYTISSLTQNTTMEVTFETISPTKYQLDVVAKGDGRAVYDGTTIEDETQYFEVEEGSSVTITFKPDNGYMIANVKVNGEDVTSLLENNQYTISNITTDMVMEVTFEVMPPTTYQLKITATGNGCVDVAGGTIKNQSVSFTIEEGESTTMVFLPDEGFRIASVKVNGQDAALQIANGQYTINGIMANTTVEVIFVEDIKALTNDDVNYAVVSYDNKTVEVVNGDYGLCLTVPASFSAKGMTWSVVGIAEGALKDCNNLAAIVWNPAVNFTETTANPNLLLYVTDRRFAPMGIANVIENGMAVNSIVLTDAADGNNFYCPQEFTTANISYTHHYGMTTGIGESRGWESIALPFDVTTVATAKGTLVPFAKWQEGDGERPFWLYELGTTGFVEAAGIKANTPYIISMPNNERYAEDYRVAGEVTFSAENVKVLATPDLSAADNQASANGRHFVPNYVCRQPENGIYTLNVNNLFENALGGFLEGSMFVRNLRQLHPFEAYITMEETNAKAAIPVFEDGTSGIRGIELFADKTNGRVHNLNGQQVKLDDDGLDRLPMGVYIINGQKIVVK